MLSSANWLLRILIFQLIFSYMILVSYDMEASKIDKFWEICITIQLD